MKHYEAVLFDLDGTLLDTAEGVLAAVKDTVAHLGLKPLTEAEYLQFNGPPMKQSMMKWFHMNEADADAATAYFRACYRSRHLLQAKPYPGVQDTLCALKAAGMGVGVATYKRTDYAKEILSHFHIAESCDMIVGDTNESNRSKADIIRLAAEAIGAALGSVVMVGDTVGDYTGAVGAGVDFIAVTYGYGFSQGGQLPAVPAFSSMPEVLNYIMK